MFEILVTEKLNKCFECRCVGNPAIFDMTAWSVGNVAGMRSHSGLQGQSRERDREYLYQTV